MSIAHEVRPTVVLVLMVPYRYLTRTGTCSSAGPRVGRHEGPLWVNIIVVVPGLLFFGL